MTISLDLDRLWTLTPNALDVYKAAFKDMPTKLAPFGIVDNPLRLAHFLAQVLHETGGLRVMQENLNYSAPRLMQVWPTRFPTLESAQPFARNPEALANRVYGGRMGNVRPGDGWRFIGRGLLQITGRTNYARVEQHLGVPLTADVTLAVHPDHALPVAGAIWAMSLCNPLADQDDVQKVTRAINGGLHGLVDRRRWLQGTKGLLEIAA